MVEQPPPGRTDIPPLSGGFLALYRLIWGGLLLSASAAVLWSWVEATTAPEILVLRLLKSAVLIAVAAILFRRRSGDPVAAMLSLAFLLWTISSSIDLAAVSLWSAMVDRCRFLLFAMALLLFPGGDWQPGWTRPAALIIFATFLLGIAEAVRLVASSLYLPLAIGCVLAALASVLARYWSCQDGAQKQQLKWVMLGLFGGIGLVLAARAGAAIESAVTMPIAGRLAIEGLLQLGISVLALGFLVSLLGYRLYDAEAAISRSAAYAGLTLALVGTFAASEAMIESLSQSYFGSGVGDLSGGIAAAIAAVLMTPLHDRISRWAEHHFQHDLVLLKQDLPDLLLALSGGASVQRLAASVLPRIEQAVQSTRTALLVDNRLVAAQGISTAAALKLLQGWQPPTTMEVISRRDEDAFSLHIALRCPLGEGRGWLLLGPRPDGSHLGKDDVEALAAIARPLERTLFQVVERERADLRHRTRLQAMSRALAAMDRRLTMLTPVNSG